MKWTLLVLVGGIVLGGQGCATIDCEGSYRLGPGFTAGQESNVREALRRWNEWSGSDARISSTGICSIEPEALDEPNLFGTWIGYGRIEIDAMKLDRWCGRLESESERDRCFQSIVMHEVGHSYGLEHIEEGIGVMSPGALPDFTDEDRRECETRGVCAGRTGR